MLIHLHFTKVIIDYQFVGTYQDINMRASKSDPVCYTNPKKGGNQHENQIKPRKHPIANKNRRCDGIVQREMEQKYDDLLREYRRVQEHEATLRNNMALLRAELILCQTRAYHRGSEDLRRITLDPLEIRRIDSKWSRNPVKCTPVQRPYIVEKYVSELGGGTLKRVPRMYSRIHYTFPAIQKHKDFVSEKKKQNAAKKQELHEKSGIPRQLGNHDDHLSGDRCVCLRCVDLPPNVVQPPRVLIHKVPTPQYQTCYRLQKQSLPEIQCKRE